MNPEALRDIHELALDLLPNQAFVVLASEFDVFELTYHL